MVQLQPLAFYAEKLLQPHLLQTGEEGVELLSMEGTQQLEHLQLQQAVVLEAVAFSGKGGILTLVLLVASRFWQEEVGVTLLVLHAQRLPVPYQGSRHLG